MVKLNPQISVDCVVFGFDEEELTGLKDIYLEQFKVFDSPDRIQNKEDVHWLRKTTDREKNVAHKPARYYQFNKRAYLRQKKDQLIFTI